MLVAVVSLLVGATASISPAAALVTTGSLSGQVTSGTTGLSAMNVWLYAVPSGAWVKATTTNASGNYSFPSLTPGTYRVQAWSSTSAYPTTWYVQGTSYATANDVVVPSGGAAPAANINVATTGSVSGTVRHLGTGVANVSVLLSRADSGALVLSTTTNGAGSYSFTSVAPGGYKISFLDSSGLYPAAGLYAQQPDVGSADVVTVTAGNNVVADQDVYRPFEQPVPAYSGNPAGPTVAVIGDSITQLSTHEIHLALDATANPSVRGISLQRVGQMQPVADKYAVTSPDQVLIALGTNDAIQGYPSAQTQADLASMVSTFPGSSCVTVLTLNATTANAAFNTRAETLNTYIRSLPSTSPNVQVADWARVRAEYFYAGSPDGEWTTDGLHLAPVGQAAFASLMASAVGACLQPASSLSGRAFGDENSNGVQDGTEAGLPDLVFTMSGSDSLGNAVSRTTTTASDGSWRFDDVPAGTYSVRETVPFDLSLPIITIGTAGGTAASAAVDAIVLAPGVDATSYVFGNPLSPASVYGAVYADTDGDGVRDAGEPGVARVAIDLDGTAANGDPVHLTTNTATDGTWGFAGLNPGTYAITETQPNGFGAASATVGSSFGGVAQPHSIANVVVTADVSGVGYLFGEVPIPAVQWANNSTGTIATIARSVAADDAGNSYVAGTFYGSSTFGSGGSAVTLVSAGGTDAYLAKYDANGGLLWAQRAGGSGDDEALKVSINGSGTLVVAGDFDGAATFGQGPAAVTLNGTEDAFVATYTSAGALTWVRQVGGATRSVGASAAIDGAGNVYLTGWFIGAADFDGSPVSGTGIASAFVARYLADGSLDWARSPASQFGSLGFDVAVDSAGRAYVGGADGGIDFGNGTSFPNVGALDAFVAQFLPDGSVGWARSFASIGNDIVFGVAVDPAGGDVFASGTFAWTVDFGSGNVNSSAGLSDAFVLRLGAGNGSTAWVRTGSSTADDQAARLSVGAGRVNVAGTYGGPATFDSKTLLSYGAGDAFAASYDLDGELHWVRPIAGASGDGGWGTATLPSGDVIVTGIIALQAAVMPGPVQVTLNGGFFASQFLARLYA
jgi:lysophospholipase L1-like esterase